MRDVMFLTFLYAIGEFIMKNMFQETIGDLVMSGDGVNLSESPVMSIK
jgi:hypothetical protein